MLNLTKVTATASRDTERDDEKTEIPSGTFHA
jgi:hypothetical protein